MKVAVVLDTNVLYSSLLKAGSTRQFLLKLFIKKDVDVYAPSRMRDELESKMAGIAIRVSRRKGMRIRRVMIALSAIKDFLLENVRFVRVGRGEGLPFVKDPDDAYFVSLALKLREKYEKVYICTMYKEQVRFRRRGVRAPRCLRGGALGAQRPARPEQVRSVSGRPSRPEHQERGAERPA